jgi:hypothetical protein
MRSISATATLIALVAAVAGGASAQGKSFEGTVTFESSGGRGESGGFAYSIKGSRVRFEPQGGRMPMYMLMDMEAQTMRVVMTAQNAYMEMELPDADDASAGASAEASAAASKNEPVNTGRTDEVAGRTCEIWTMAEDGKEFEMCLARDMGTFMQGGGPMMGRGRAAPPAWQRELRKGGFFPLRVAEKTGGTAKTVLVATKVEEKKLDDALFDVPAGANKMSMPPGMGRRP